MRVILTRTNSSESPRNMTVVVAFNSIFFGGVDTLLPVMEQSFPELGLTRERIALNEWIESILYFPEFRLDSIEGLLNRTQPDVRYFKATSDYIQKPIPEHVLRGMFRRFFEAEAEEAVLVLNPYGGRMAEISPSAIPFPHRKGNLYSILYWVYWREENAGNSDRYIDWIRRFFRYMTPYVSKNPRGAYINYRDLDLGVNNDVGPTSYAQASTWGFPYFKKANFDRLVRVKTRVDPRNFFRNEQSIPPVHSSWSSM
ncbi:hypothetical protein DH2020_042431 [Rehmannia glutinosa]|uniref:Berberine/berberine-like domain-containing protein n=1 Tax=Rehmannia glutinosa TaxID=99300 RepID=A0ABR0UMD8_REHGL